MKTIGLLAIGAAVVAAIIYALHNMMPNTLAGMLPNVAAVGAVSAMPAGPYATNQPDISGSQVAQDTSVTTPTQLEGSPIGGYVPQARVASSQVVMQIPPAAAFSRQAPKAVQPASFSGYHVPIVGVAHVTPPYAKAPSSTVFQSANQFSAQNLRPSSPSAGVRNTAPAKYRAVWTPEQARPTPVARGTITGTSTKAAASTPGSYSPKLLSSVVTPKSAVVTMKTTRRTPTGPIARPGLVKISA